MIWPFPSHRACDGVGWCLLLRHRSVQLRAPPRDGSTCSGSLPCEGQLLTPAKSDSSRAILANARPGVHPGSNSTRRSMSLPGRFDRWRVDPKIFNVRMWYFLQRFPSASVMPERSSSLNTVSENTLAMNCAGTGRPFLPANESSQLVSMKQSKGRNRTPGAVCRSTPYASPSCGATGFSATMTKRM